MINMIVIRIAGKNDIDFTNINIYNATVENEFAHKEFSICGNDNDYDDGGTCNKSSVQTDNKNIDSGALDELKDIKSKILIV